MGGILSDRRILLVDDDADGREAMARYLAGHGLDVSTARDAETMDRQLSRGRVDLVLLDVLMPPGEDGLSICRRMSAAAGPAVILMGDGADEVDRIVGLELGADDYVAKPCNPRELLARIRAVIRRVFGAVVGEPRSAIRFEGFRLDLLSRELWGPDGARIDLAPAEYALLKAFLDRPQRILSRDQLAEWMTVRGLNATGRAIDTRACRLRRLLHPDLIETVRHQGYRFNARTAFEGA